MNVFHNDCSALTKNVTLPFPLVRESSSVLRALTNYCFLCWVGLTAAAAAAACAWDVTENLQRKCESVQMTCHLPIRSNLSCLWSPLWRSRRRQSVTRRDRFGAEQGVVIFRGRDLKTQRQQRQTKSSDADRQDMKVIPSFHQREAWMGSLWSDRLYSRHTFSLGLKTGSEQTEGRTAATFPENPDKNFRLWFHILWL